MLIKNQNIKLLAPLLFLIFVPVFYNSCSEQQDPIASNSKSSTQSCKLAALKASGKIDVVQDLSQHEEVLNSAPTFDNSSKLQLSSMASDEASGALNKLNNVKIDNNQELSVLVQLDCARENKNSVAWNFIKDQILDPEWRIQAFNAKYSDLTQIQNYEEALEQDECIKGVSFNHVYAMQALPPSYQLNDPYAYSQSHFRAINAQASFAYFYNATMGIRDDTPKVKVAVLDTGIQYNHPEFSNQFFRFGGSNMWWGRDVTQDGLAGTGTQIHSVQDISTDGHGTHVAGIIGAHINNSIGVAGIASKAVQLMNYKVFTNNLAIIPSCQSGSLCTTSTIVANAIHDAILDAHGAKVINLSLGRLAGLNDSKVDNIYKNAIAQAINAGAVVVIAGGNTAGSSSAQLIDDTNFTVIPARYGKDFNGAITVGSFTINYEGQNQGKSPFSHYSIQHIEIGAPGAEGSSGLWSTSKKIGFAGQGEYQKLLGTSISAPMVAAAAALAISMFRQTYGTDPTPAVVEEWIISSAKKSSSLAPYFKDGNALDLHGLAKLLNARMPEMFEGSNFSSCK